MRNVNTGNKQHQLIKAKLQPTSLPLIT